MRLLLAFILAMLVYSPLAAQETYTVGVTEYYYGRVYSTTGKPMVKRSDANRAAFLRSKGYTDVPLGYEVDHIIPLHMGGTDDPSNMQLLTKEEHARKTASERSRTTYSSSPYRPSSYRSTYTTSPNYTPPTKNYPKPSTYSLPTYSSPSRTIHTGPRGGRYYINSNGNKTYLKKR